MASTRLTQEMKTAFVNAVMNDVPVIDYNDPIAKIVRADAFEQTPKVIQPLANYKSEESTWLSRNTWQSSSVLGHREMYEYYDNRRKRDYSSQVLANVASVSIFWPTYLTFNLSAPAAAQVKALVSEWDVNVNMRTQLRKTMTNTISRLVTVKALQDAFPELHKYMPQEAVAYKEMLPATNMIRELMDAGWTGKKPEPKLAPLQPLPKRNDLGMKIVTPKPKASRKTTKKVTT